MMFFFSFILVQLWRKLLAYINTLESVPGTNQYWAISVKFIAQRNNGLSLTGFEPIWLAILRLLVRRVNYSTTAPCTNEFTRISMHFQAQIFIVKEPDDLDELTFNLPVIKECGSGVNINVHALQFLDEYCTCSYRF